MRWFVVISCGDLPCLVVCIKGSTRNMFQNTVRLYSLGTLNRSFIVAVVKSVIKSVINPFIVIVKRLSLAFVSSQQSVGIVPILRTKIVGINGSTCFIFQNTIRYPTVLELGSY